MYLLYFEGSAPMESLVDSLGCLSFKNKMVAIKTKLLPSMARSSSIQLCMELIVKCMASYEMYKYLDNTDKLEGAPIM
jgi:hypothetical protein